MTTQPLLTSRPLRAKLSAKESAAGSAEASVPARRPRREWKRGLRGLARFVTTPSDLANSFDAMFSLAGPTLEREFRRFADHPVGRSMLAERPRRDLNALLGDHAALAARMNTQTTFPSFGYEALQGATTLWEQFGGGGTHNHIVRAAHRQRQAQFHTASRWQSHSLKTFAKPIHTPS